MGSRKELLKKSLGISEYPWTSDDEMDESLSRIESTGPDEVTVFRPARHSSTPDMPGTSGLQQQQTSPQSQSTSAAAAAATAASSRRQAKFDRDLFWSILNTPSTPIRLSPPPPPPPPTAATVRTRMQLMIPGPQRIVHTPAADYRERERNSDRSSTIADIQKMLTLRRLTRNVNGLRLGGGHYTMSRGNSSVTVPSEATSTLRISRPHRATYRRYTPLRIVPGYGRFGGSSNEVNSEQLSRARARDTNEQDVPTSTAQIQVNINIHQSDEEQENSPPSALAPIADEVNLVQDESSEQIASNNTSGVTEEEIVEIDPDDAAPAAVELEDGSVSNDDGSRVSQHRDPNLASTSRSSSERQLEAQPTHGVKRKRRDSDEYPEPYTVKEFNQDLLRLLECPVCLEWMEPPMSQCRRGHLVCGRCRARLAACPVCRTSFSSVRNRAMEGVAEMLRYPCRHGCGREVRLRRRAPHEASCVQRHYLCPAPACRDAVPLPRDKLPLHFQSKHMQILKIGSRHKFSMKLNTEQHDNWLILALDEYFHLRIDVDIRVVVYVAYIGPKCDAKLYNYEVSVEGQNSTRKMVYARSTHSDLESPSLNMSRQDCFHMTIDQALNFIRFKNRHCDSEKFLDFTVEISKCESSPKEESDS